MKSRVPLYGKQGFAVVDDAATDGAMVGVNLRYRDGSLVPASAFAGGTAPPAEQFPITAWSRLLEIPDLVGALAGTTTPGLFVVVDGDSTATRTLELAAGELDGTNLNGVAGNPVLGLADVTDIGGGTLQRTDFDAKGRKTGTSAATTDDLTEAGNLYFTAARAVAALAASYAGLPNALDDAAAAIAGVPVGGPYRNGSVLMVRIT